MAEELSIEEKHGLPKSFCIIPWMHLNVNPTGTVLQCCVSSVKGEVGNLKDNTLAEIWNNTRMRSLRLALLNGEQPSSCQKCYEQESNRIPSFRVGINPFYEHHLDNVISSTNTNGSVDDMTLRYWDFRFSNLCNMKCRTCCHDFSSSWHGDMMEMYGPNSVPKDPVIHINDRSIDDIYTILDQQIDNVEEIYFAGGEPLIMDEHYYILEKLIAKGRRDVRLRYSTNLMKIKYKQWDNIELWRHFDSVKVHASLDGCGPKAEYIRYGTVWETIDNNIKRLVNEPAVEFFVSPTIQVMNLLHIPELIDCLIKSGVKPGHIRINNVLTTPSHLHINTLGDNYKAIAKRLFETHVSAQHDLHHAMDLRNQYDSLLSYMGDGKYRTPEQIDNIKKTFKHHVNMMDKTRGENLLTTFPELKDHWDSH